MALNTQTKAQIIKDYALFEGDTGSPEVQVALLTHSINELTEHLKKHKKDNHCYYDRRIRAHVLRIE